MPKFEFLIKWIVFHLSYAHADPSDFAVAENVSAIQYNDVQGLTSTNQMLKPSWKRKLISTKFKHELIFLNRNLLFS